MDASVKLKLREVAKALEDSKGRLRLFACIWRPDVKKWDILVSADWVNYQKLQENIGDIFDVFKSQFNGEFALRFSGIYPLSTKEPLIKNLTELFAASSGTLELNEIQVGDVKIEKMVLIVSRAEAEDAERK